MNENKNSSTPPVYRETEMPQSAKSGFASADAPETTASTRTTAAGEPVSGVPSPRSRMLMSRDRAALLVIDVQEKLLPHIQNQSIVSWNIRRLIDGAAVLGVPCWGTEQYPQGLGGTVPMLADRLPIVEEKSLFSCRECVELLSRLRRDNRSQLLLCGIETHVCVQQTALDLIAMGFDVWVAVDVVGSRFELDHSIALRRMQAAGVVLTTTESVLFEWCEVAGTHEFKRISALVRETAPEKTDVPAARFFPRAAPRYVLQSDHQEVVGENNQVVVQLHYLVRNTDLGTVAKEYRGEVIRGQEDPTQIVSQKGVQSVEVTVDGTAIGVQDERGQSQMVYLPIGDARTNHPRWKVRRRERHIASEQYQHDYEITFQVVDYKSDATFREFTGYEHRIPDSDDCSHVSGVRQVEISSDGRWVVVTELGRPPQLIELPAED